MTSDVYIPQHFYRVICIHVLSSSKTNVIFKFQVSSLFYMTLFAQFSASSLCSHDFHVLTYRQKQTLLFMQIIIFPHVRVWPIWICCLEGFSDKFAAKIISVAILSRSKHKMTGIYLNITTNVYIKAIVLVDLNEFPSIFQKVQHSHSRHLKTTSNLLSINLKGKLRFFKICPLEGAIHLYIILW